MISLVAFFKWLKLTVDIKTLETKRDLDKESEKAKYEALSEKYRVTKQEFDLLKEDYKSLKEHLT